MGSPSCLFPLITSSDWPRLSMNAASANYMLLNEACSRSIELQHHALLLWLHWINHSRQPQQQSIVGRTASLKPQSCSGTLYFYNHWVASGVSIWTVIIPLDFFLSLILSTPEIAHLGLIGQEGDVDLSKSFNGFGGAALHHIIKQGIWASCKKHTGSWHIILSRESCVLEFWQ